MTKRALLSVSDKTGLVDLSQSLVASGWELIASGGTARTLSDAGIAVSDVADVTGAPEMLGGRVKTLHPAIAGGILAGSSEEDTAELAERGIAPIDLVVCNLYPFAATVARLDVSEAEAVEQIDIGGVTLLRAAAKNFERVTVVCEPADYGRVVEALHTGDVDRVLRRELALKAFAHTRDYDAAITAYFEIKPPRAPHEIHTLPDRMDALLIKRQELRYGENPHQTAALYGFDAQAGPLGGRLIQGKELSYNNLLDLDAAWRAAESFVRPAVVIVKHLSPCGIAIGPTAAAAFPKALASDPVSAFGGVIATNRPVDAALIAAPGLADLFIEAIIAPAFTDEAVAWFASHKKNCRLVGLHESIYDPSAMPEWRTIRSGLVVQTRDGGDPPDAEWRVVTRRAPNDEESAAIHLAWIACQHVKSNAIVLADRNATVGIGGGLPSRVDAVKLAVVKAGKRARGAVMASDAFFPFADGIEVAAEAGVGAVVQPGGSVRDDEVIATADRLGLAMVFTGVRHFRH